MYYKEWIKPNETRPESLARRLREKYISDKVEYEDYIYLYKKFEDDLGNLHGAIYSGIPNETAFKSNKVFILAPLYGELEEMLPDIKSSIEEDKRSIEVRRYYKSIFDSSRWENRLSYNMDVLKCRSSFLTLEKIQYSRSMIESFNETKYEDYLYLYNSSKDVNGEIRSINHIEVANESEFWVYRGIVLQYFYPILKTLSPNISEWVSNDKIMNNTRVPGQEEKEVPTYTELREKCDDFLNILNSYLKCNVEKLN